MVRLLGDFNFSPAVKLTLKLVLSIFRNGLNFNSERE